MGETNLIYDIPPYDCCGDEANVKERLYFFKLYTFDPSANRALNLRWNWVFGTNSSGLRTVPPQCHSNVKPTIQ